MACTKVYDLKPVHLLRIRQDDESVTRPDLVFNSLVCILHFRLQLCTIRTVEVATKRSVVDLSLDPLPGERAFRPIPQLSARFLKAPYERAWIESIRGATL